ncbi:hypothetical protein BX285_3847 [Streptomyces sp. 1114.5]|uniref:hypothetical protein n=1 Tax=unclassified Streptomyces TaxID=2593676 RepID=UPI000BC8F56D|nr:MULTISPECIES: hypothetical protein [unclassified Streptomyces]RKT19389.1 hypothetical protein BX285_3847 [Streptomyces sp. 1114.5]SOB85585.1 hypothetical protein SAMN06272789_5875 [Streptomyces sp. 1331.2]
MRLTEWDREFMVWSYGFGRSRLLFRSEPRFEADERIDVLFSDIRDTSISADLASLSIDRIETPEEARDLGIGAAVPPAPEGLFALNSGAVHVIATHCQGNADHEWVDARAFRAVPRGVK